MTMTTMEEKTDYTNFNQLMEDNTTRRFHIEYQDYLTNHMSHGLHALRVLQAPPDTVKRFVLHQYTKLEDAGLHRDREDAGPQLSVAELLGAQHSFYKLYAHYEDLLKDKFQGSTRPLVTSEFATLSPGLMGAALHGLIHLGYGLASGQPWFVCEGLAYLHQHYLPLGPAGEAPKLDCFGAGELSLLEVVKQLRCDDALIRFMHDSQKERLGGGEFSRKVHALFKYKPDILLRYVHRIKTPETLRAGTFTLSDVPELRKWLIDSAVVVYALAETPNDFFLLHGVTAAWGLGNILPILKDADQVLDVVRTFLCALCAVYLAQGSPPLQTELLSSTEGASYAWADLVYTAMELDHGDEHTYKLMQVCKGMSEANTDPTMDRLYKIAVKLSLDNDFIF